MGTSRLAVSGTAINDILPKGSLKSKINQLLQEYYSSKY